MWNFIYAMLVVEKKRGCVGFNFYRLQHRFIILDGLSHNIPSNFKMNFYQTICLYLVKYLVTYYIQVPLSLNRNEGVAIFGSALDFQLILKIVKG